MLDTITKSRIAQYLTEKTLYKPFAYFLVFLSFAYVARQFLLLDTPHRIFELIVIGFNSGIALVFNQKEKARNKYENQIAGLRQQIAVSDKLLDAYKISARARGELESYFGEHLILLLAKVRKYTALLAANQTSYNCFDSNGSYHAELQNIVDYKLPLLSKGCIIGEQNRPVDLQTMISELVKIYTAQIQEFGLEISINVKVAFQEISFDHVLLHQILVNLLRESIACAKPGSKINITAAVKGLSIVITIKDDGFGILEDELKSGASPSATTPFALDLDTICEAVMAVGGMLDVKCVIGNGKVITLALSGMRRQLVCDNVIPFSSKNFCH